MFVSSGSHPTEMNLTKVNPLTGGHLLFEKNFGFRHGANAPVIITPPSPSQPNHLPPRVAHPPNTPSPSLFPPTWDPSPSSLQNLCSHSQSSDLSLYLSSPEMSPLLRSRCSAASPDRPTVLLWSQFSFAFLWISLSESENDSLSFLLDSILKVNFRGIWNQGWEFWSSCPCHAGRLNLPFRFSASAILGVAMTDQVTWGITHVVEARIVVWASESARLCILYLSISDIVFLDVWEELIWRKSGLLKLCRRRLCMKVGWCGMADGRSAGPSFTCVISCSNLGCSRITRRSPRIIK